MAPGKQLHLRPGVYMHLVQGVDTADWCSVPRQRGTVALLDAAALDRPVLAQAVRGRPLQLVVGVGQDSSDRKQ